MAPVAGGSLGDLYSQCVQMVNENKISVKNAFDLPLIENMEDIVDSFMGGSKAKEKKRALDAERGVRPSNGRKSVGPSDANFEEEHRFHEASCTIEASARIYACRVDSVHTDTYRVLGGLSSTDAGDEDGAAGEGGEKAGAKKRRICGVNTLEKNEANIVQHSIEADEQSDPTFRRMAAQFDAGGAKGLLLSHLPIAEDLSLVFNGDVPLTRASAIAATMFVEAEQNAKQLDSVALGLGDTRAAVQKISEARLCPQVDELRTGLYGDAQQNVALPGNLDALLQVASLAGAAPQDGAVPLMDAGADDAFAAGGDDGFADHADLPSPGGMDGMPNSFSPVRGPDSAPLPLADARVGVAGVAGGDVGLNTDVIAFDHLFEKFCGGGGGHQFAYFDACWAKQLARDKDGRLCDPLGDAEDAAGGALVPADEKDAKEKPQKRPLFDLASLDQPPRPIETEPVHKHQLSERAAQWQLHKDVPPYMIDRITMPSWPTWTKCDFACLGLRPHLMLKLVKKPQPTGDGPHGFADLFSTVVVENPEAHPWLPSGAAGRGGGDDDDDVRMNLDAGFGEEGDDELDANGLPAHMDMNPEDLFLGPDDRVLPGCDTDDLPGGDADDPSFQLPGGFDFELAEQPNIVGSTEIGYSRNSKFVDVKLVKKHLWDCMSEDIEDAKLAIKSDKNNLVNTSFQALVNRTVSRLPKGETENLSVAVCFICALHLCNEKGLELQTDKNRPLGDFGVVGKCA
mmetsp:Transcript_67046/g.175808  ORF Transcript_67046/g.175808 Transcript_67046/m.175808 type:complete len:740 (-) Transcript_67046:247-2466(-)